jgi:hypothetical protein
MDPLNAPKDAKIQKRTASINLIRNVNISPIAIASALASFRVFGGLLRRF